MFFCNSTPLQLLLLLVLELSQMEQNINLICDYAFFFLHNVFFIVFYTAKLCHLRNVKTPYYFVEIFF